MLQERFIRFSEFNPVDFEGFFDSEEGKWAGDSGLLRPVKKKVRISGMDGIIRTDLGAPSKLEKFWSEVLSEDGVEIQAYLNYALVPSDDQESQPGHMMSPCRDLVFKGPQHRIDKMIKKLEDFVLLSGGKIRLMEVDFE